LRLRHIHNEDDCISGTQLLKTGEGKQYDFILLGSFSIIQKPQQLITYYLTKRNRFKVFIWNHISSLPFELIQNKKNSIHIIPFFYSAAFEKEF